MKKILKRDEFITTYTGKKFHIFNPKPEELDIKDVAHSLSLQCRFNGHTRCFYSVASHSMIGAELIAKPFKKQFLGHETGEVITGDLVTPIKRKSPEFIKMEKKIEKVLNKKFGLPYPFSKEVKEMDNLMFRMEFVYLMGGKNETNEIFPLTKKEFMKKIDKPHKQIEQEFLKMYNKLK